MRSSGRRQAAPLAWENKIKNDFETVYDTLHEIYQKHRREHRENGDSKQMCCMWSTDDPPDAIEGTPPFDDIENVFDIIVDRLRAFACIRCVGLSLLHSDKESRYIPSAVASA